MFTSPFKRINPDYSGQLQNRPKANPIFITVDWRCLNYIKHHGGLCLFCKKEYEISLYDFSVCYQREMWVIYITVHDRARSLQLGRAIQLSGARKVLIISMNPELLSEVRYVNR